MSANIIKYEHEKIILQELYKLNITMFLLTAWETKMLLKPGRIETAQG
jgi:hypothetical protein